MAGALSITGVLNADLCRVDPLFTKTTLEHIERELRRHVDHLAARRTAVHAPPPLPALVELEPVAGRSGLAQPVEEESSGLSGQYLTAASRSSLDVEEHPSASSIFHSADDGNNNDDNLLESVV